MFVVTEADAAAIRAVYRQRGELSAVIELRRRFPGITDNWHALHVLTRNDGVPRGSAAAPAASAASHVSIGRSLQAL